MLGVTFRDHAFLGRISLSDPFPVTPGLLLRNESYDFDGSSGGTGILNWNDHSGGNHFWTAETTNPTVDQTIKANGHATVKFVAGSSNSYSQTDFFASSGYSGLEMMIVYRHAADPPNDPDGAGGAITFNQNNNDSSHQPYADGNFYENFALSARRNIGNPTTSVSSAFVCYNIAAAADGSAYDAWINSEHLYTSSSYTFNQKGIIDQNGSANAGYRMGRAISVGFKSYFFKGNIACCYVWNRRLSSGERTSMQAYITSVYGISF